MREERKPYTLSELHTLLEMFRMDKDDTLNIPRAFLCLVSEMLDLTDRVQYLESINEEGINLVDGDDE